MTEAERMKIFLASLDTGNSEFLDGLDEVLCVEELDPYIERELIYVCGKYGLKTKILGKMTGHMPRSGENSRDSVIFHIFE